MTPTLPPEELAALVREVIAETLPALLAERLGASSPAPVASTDDALVARVAALCADESIRIGLASGRIRLSEVADMGPGAGTHHVERGAVTETAVRRAHSAGARLVVGRRAVLTPLARDRARALGVIVEKEK